MCAGQAATHPPTHPPTAYIHHHARAARAGRPCPPASERSLDSAHLVSNAAQAGGANVDLQACAGSVEGYRLGGNVGAGLSQEQRCREQRSEHAIFTAKHPKKRHDVQIS